MSDYDELCEKYMVRRVRSFYPRKFDLSPEFVEAFKLEYSRLVESGKINERCLKGCAKH